MIDYIVLAGGFGTRIRNVLRNTIKPMARFSDRPFISIIIDNLIDYGIENFVICAGYGYKQIVNYFNHKNNNTKYHILLKKKIPLLWTGGAIKKAIPLIKSEKFLVVNGDSICFENYSDFIKTNPTEKILCVNFRRIC